MVITPPSISPAPPGEGDPAPDAGLAARVASGPGFWTDWLEELDRQGLLEELLADDVIARALREAPAGHRYDRVLAAKMTVVCVLVACLFPGAGYDTVLATAFGLPGLRFKPGTQVPAGSAFSQARRLLGEQVMKRLFELDAARSDAPYRDMLGCDPPRVGALLISVRVITAGLREYSELQWEMATPIGSQSSRRGREAVTAQRTFRLHCHAAMMVGQR
jgi:hypothetical protein